MAPPKAGSSREFEMAPGACTPDVIRIQLERPSGRGTLRRAPGGIKGGVADMSHAVRNGALRQSVRSIEGWPHRVRWATAPFRLPALRASIGARAVRNTPRSGG